MEKQPQKSLSHNQRSIQKAPVHSQAVRSGDQPYEEEREDSAYEKCYRDGSAANECWRWDNRG